MKPLLTLMCLTTSAWAPSALAASRANSSFSVRSATAAVKADAAAHGLVGASKVVVTGESFTILSPMTLHAGSSRFPRSIDRVLASGTLDRQTGKVTSFNPILME